MKYTLTGGAGNVTKPLALQLLSSGQNVTVISRNKNHLLDITNAGAEVAAGSVEDLDFLKAAFAGSDAVYTMYPPSLGTTNIMDLCANIGNNYAKAIQHNGIKFAVNLSSVGAHLPSGAGHVCSLHKPEEFLNDLGINIIHLRPVYFYTNLFAQIDLIKGMGVMGSNFSVPAPKFPVVHPIDIADVAAKALMELSFGGSQVQYVASDDIGTSEIATAIGKRIGRPNLTWSKFTDEEMQGSLRKAGMPEETAKLFVEGFRAIDTGKIFEDYYSIGPKNMGRIKLAEFADIFARIYNHPA